MTTSSAHTNTSTAVVASTGSGGASGVESGCRTVVETICEVMAITFRT